MVATVVPKKSTPGGLAVGDVLPRVVAVAEDIVTVVKLEQNWNALLPILVTESGIIIDVKLKQELNAKLPIVVSVEVGVNVTYDIKEKSNALEPIVVTVFPIVTPIKLNVGSGTVIAGIEVVMAV
jgi:hypothetical protein